MKLRDKWELMVDIVSQCLNDPSGVHSPEQVMEDAIQGASDISKESANFVRETISGTLHFEKVCEGVFKGYCDSVRRNKAGRWSMYLVAYLMIFRYTALGGHYLREFFYRCTSTLHLVEYLEYILDLERLLKYSGEYWRMYYDSSFITGGILRPIEDIALHAQEDLVLWLRQKTAAGVVGVTPFETTTGQESERRTPQEKRPLSSRSPPPRSHSPSPPPPPLSSMSPDTTLKGHRRAKLPPAEVREMLYTIPEKRPPRIDCTKPPSMAIRSKKSLTKPAGFSFINRPPHRREAKAEDEHALADKSSLLRRRDPEEVREMFAKPVTVRPTAGTIHREAHLYAKKLEAEQRSLNEMEAALHDTRGFEDWRRQERMRAEKERAEEILHRRVALQDCAENAARKRLQLESKNRSVVAKMREDIASHVVSKATEKEQVTAKQRSYVSRLRHDLEENRKKAVFASQQEKVTAAAEVKAENERLREVVMEETDRMKTKRLHTIHEIMQLMARNRQRKAEMQNTNLRALHEIHEDAAAYGGMSLAVLREELERVQAESKQLEEERRQQVRARRAKEQEKLHSLKNFCAEGRERRRLALEEERRTQRAEKDAMEAAREASEAKRAAQVHESLQQKRAQRREEFIALNAEDRRRRNELMLLAKGTTAMEESHWKQQELCVINRLTASQNENFRTGFM